MSSLPTRWRIAPLALGLGLLALLAVRTPMILDSSPRQPGMLGRGIGEQPALDRTTSNGVGPPLGAQPGAEMVVVPAGEFLMGGQPLDGAGRGDVVWVAAFAIDRTEVTNAAFAAFVRQTGYLTVAEQVGDTRSWRTQALPDLALHPVVFVAWADAVAYCAHHGKRLPSETEWEKAARGADARLWPWGHEWDETRANSLERGATGTSPVGAFPTGASPYGVVDLAGNVWEWTSSVYLERLGPNLRDREDSDVFRGHRVLRGGSWRTMALGTQVTYRKPAPPDFRRDSTGFRCAGAVSGVRQSSEHPGQSPGGASARRSIAAALSPAGRLPRSLDHRLPLWRHPRVSPRGRTASRAECAPQPRRSPPCNS